MTPGNNHPGKESGSTKAQDLDENGVFRNKIQITITEYSSGIGGSVSEEG